MCMSLLSSPVCWNTVNVTENRTLYHAFCDYFGLQGVTVTTLTKTTISCSEIIIRRRSQDLLSRLEMLYTTNNLRIPVDGVTSIYRGTLQCFEATFVFPYKPMQNKTQFVTRRLLTLLLTHLWPTILEFTNQNVRHFWVAIPICDRKFVPAIFNLSPSHRTSKCKYLCPIVDVDHRQC